MNVVAAAFQVILGALIYGAAALVGTMLAMALVPHLKRFEDGPEPTEVSPVALICGAAFIGGLIAGNHPAMPELLIGAIASLALVAVWYCDARTGIMPDVFTLAPLGIALIYGFAVTHQLPQMLLWAMVLFVPFAVAALLSRGRGMGWGDAKLAAFAGVLLGPVALLALGIASLAAVVVTAIRHRSQRVPIAFAPYLVTGIALGIVLNAYKTNW